MIKKFLFFLGLLVINKVLFAQPAKTFGGEEQFQRKIFMLESALAPTNPEAVATTWAKAKKERNGAVQYMLMCPTLQKTNLANFRTLNWVTGASSPWISQYKITPEGKKGSTFGFTIQYQLVTSNGPAGTQIDSIKISPVTPQFSSSQQWCISQLNTREKFSTL